MQIKHSASKKLVRFCDSEEFVPPSETYKTSQIAKDQVAMLGRAVARRRD